MSLFNFTQNAYKPKQRYLYAVKNGDYAGHFIAYISSFDDKHFFLTLPNNQKLEVPIKDFEEGLKNKLLDFVEKMPKNVWKVVKAQYDSSN
tara:strand:+ start:826 stop:1098 length:273 start_codon:yes stop_codon:yes gene_type:complete